MLKPLPQRPEILLVSNVLSTANRRLLASVREVARQHPALAHIEVSDIEDLQRQLETYRGHALKLLILNGGDGTLHAALSHIINHKTFEPLPPVAFLAGGMTNIVAKDFGLGGSGAKQLKIILDRYQSGDLPHLYTQRNLVAVHFKEKRKPEFGFFFGTGMIISGIRMCRDQLYPKGIRGTPAQAIAFVAHAASMFRETRSGPYANFTPMQLRFSNNQTIEGELSTVMITTLRRLLYGVHAPVVDGQLSVFTLRPRMSNLIKAYWYGLRGNIKAFNEEGMTLSFDHQVQIAGSSDFVMEGEIFNSAATDPLKISCAPPLTIVSFLKNNTTLANT